MIFLKKLLLKLRLSLSKGRSTRELNSVNFSQAQKIGLLIYLHDSSLLNEIEAFAKDLMKEGKKIEALSFSERPSAIRFSFPCTYFSFKDLDWTGNFKGESINKFIKTSYDYLYSINIFPILPFHLITRKCMAKCRVGQFEENGDLDLMIEIGKAKNLSFLLEQMKIYSKKINSNE